MTKIALDIDPAIVGRQAVGGALVGGSTAALVNLLHSVLQAHQERKKRLRGLETDENTIVLTLPNKTAEIAAPAVAPKLEQTKSGDFMVQRDKAQSRETGSGRYGPKLVLGDKTAAATGWPTLTAAALAAIGGGTAGAAFVNKLYEVQRERRLKAELEAAQNEYMDLLRGGRVKGASVIEDMFGYDADEKQADGSAFGMLNYPMAALALMTILGTGATGYLTKKVLDEKLKETEDQNLDVPKVKRIVFQTEPVADPEKMASAEEHEAVLASLMLMMDKVAGAEQFLGVPEVKAAMAEAGMTKQALYDQASNINQVWGMLLDKPDLRRALYRVGLDYTSKGPARFFKQLALSTDMGLRRADKHVQSMFSTKAAQDVATPLASMGASLFGAGAARELLDKSLTPQELARLIVAAQEDVKHQQLLARAKAPDQVQVIAKDPTAAAFVKAHKKPIASITRRLAAEGQL